jgi:hypothetical protein
MYFNTATMTISEIGAHGDSTLSGDEYNRDDRSKRIGSAASALCDWVFEYLMETEGSGEWGDMGRFKQEHLSRIERMVAIGMMAQFEHDLRCEPGLLIADLLREENAV